MEISTFLLHFGYISGIFIAGVVVGWLTYNKVSEKVFRKKEQIEE